MRQVVAAKLLSSAAELLSSAAKLLSSAARSLSSAEHAQAAGALLNRRLPRNTG